MFKKNILIVDDELNILKSIRRILEENYTVEVALGGQEAIDLLNKSNSKFDVVLSDFTMPGVNGQALYEYIKNNFKGLEERIIFMTGGTYSVDVKIFFDKHSNPCLLKPFEQEELLRVIESI